MKQELYNSKYENMLIQCVSVSKASRWTVKGRQKHGGDFFWFFLDWIYLVSSEETVLADGSSALATDMSDSKAEL